MYSSRAFAAASWIRFGRPAFFKKVSKNSRTRTQSNLLFADVLDGQFDYETSTYAPPSDTL